MALSLVLVVAYFQSQVGASTVLWPLTLHRSAIVIGALLAAIAGVSSAIVAVRRGGSVGAIGIVLGAVLLLCTGMLAPLELLGGWISPSPTANDPYALLDGAVWRATTVETGDFMYATRLYRCDAYGLVCHWCADGPFAATAEHTLQLYGDVLTAPPVCDRVARPGESIYASPG